MDYKLIHKKIHGSLTPDEENRFQQWYESSQDHRAYFDRVRHQQQDGTFIKPDTSKAWKRFEKKVTPKTKIPFHWVAVAAAIVIAVVLFPVLFNNQGIPSGSPVVDSQNAEIINDAIVLIDDQGRSQLLSQEDTLTGSYFSANNERMKISSEATASAGPAAGMNTIIVPRKMQYKLQLSDGTNIWLNSATKISFPTSFDKLDSRTVKLEYGEAYFEVTSRDLAQRKNFIVETEDQSIEVMGTKFNISAYANEESIATTLVEGAVAVKGNGRSTELQPGQQSILLKGAGSLYVQKVDSSKVISWREGTYVFQEKSLAEIMRVLERWYDVEVSFEGEMAKKELFNGVLRNDQDLEVIVQILESTHKAAFELKGNSIKIRDKQEGNGA